MLMGSSTINYMIKTFDEEQLTDEGMEDKYLQWMQNLPRYYTEGKTIFVHAGIDEEAGDLWEWGTVLESGVIPVLMVDTNTDKYYRVTESGNWLILPYDEEN